MVIKGDPKNNGEKGKGKALLGEQGIFLLLESGEGP